MKLTNLLARIRCFVEGHSYMLMTFESSSEKTTITYECSQCGAKKKEVHYKKHKP